MGSPRSFFDGENQDAIGILNDYLKAREPYQEDDDVIDGMFIALANANLVVVKKSEWDDLSSLLNPEEAFPTDALAPAAHHRPSAKPTGSRLRRYRRPRDSKDSPRTGHMPTLPAAVADGGS